MSSKPPSAQEIANDARWLVQAIDPQAGMVRLVATDREIYRNASFLDDRMMTPTTVAHVVPWNDVAAAAERIERQDARWIFHIGHVGSTLISRMVGEIPSVLAIREPRSLRDVAWSTAEQRLPFLKALPRLMSRTFDDTETACIKATSFANELASKLLPQGGGALFVTASPANYIGTILAGENSVRELRMLAPIRAERLRKRGIELTAEETDDAHLAAVAWACEMTSLEANAEELAGRSIHWVDFDVLLGNPRGGLAEIAHHLGFAVSDAELVRIVSGPILRRYSKAMEYEYSSQLRNDVIAETRRYHHTAIDRALTMLDTAASRSPLLERALNRSGEIACSASYKS